MRRQHLQTVTVTAEMFWLSDDSLLFVFGPSGAYFDPLLELTLRREFVQGQSMLLDESGEATDCRHEKQKHTKIFYIPHFSSYSYDLYDEY